VTTWHRFLLPYLAAFMIVAPALTFHPISGHLLGAGMGNLPAELTHPQVLWSLALTMVSAFPAAALTVTTARALAAQRLVRELRRESTSLSHEGISYRLVTGPRVTIFTAGLFRPTTFVTTGAKARLTAAQLHAALLHEESHRRRHDVAWRLLLRGASSACMFVPGLREAVEREILRTECVADDYALDRGAPRGDLFEAIIATGRDGTFAYAAGMGGGSTGFRLARIAEPGSPLPSEPLRDVLTLGAIVAFPAIAGHAMVWLLANCSPYVG
jgi:hypothetical protein